MAIVDIHEQSGEKVVPIRSASSTEELSTIKKVKELLERSKRATDDQRSSWIDNYRFVIDGRQWPIERPSWRFSETVNLSLATLLQEIGVQTDSRPKTDYIATEPSDVQFADTIKIINDSNWSKPRIQGFGWLQKLTEMLMDCKLADFAVAEVAWDTELENGLGDICFKRLDPMGFFWDPSAMDLQEARWAFYVEPIPTEKLKAKHADKSARIKPDVYKMDRSDRATRVSIDTDKFRLAGTLGTSSGNLYKENEKYGGEDMTMLIRCWLKDDALEEVELEAPDADGNKFVMKKQYPKGRYIEIANDVVLKDGENGVEVDGQMIPYEDGLFPLCILKNYAVPGKFEGLNEVTNIRGPQTIYNYLWSHTLDQARMASNPQHVVQHGALDNPEDLTNEPGLIVEVNDIGQYRRESGVGIAPGMFNMLDAAKAAFDNVQGLGEVSRGVPQGNVTSGLQLEGFVEAAQTRPRLKNRNLDEFLQQFAYLGLSRMLQFYTKPRIFRLTGDEAFPEFVEFFITDDGVKKQANIRRTVVRDGVPIDAGQQTMEVKGMPDVRSISGSALPFAKAQKSAQALSLFNAGAIDRDSVLDAVDWPNKEEVLQRMQEMEAKAAEAQNAQPK